MKKSTCLLLLTFVLFVTNMRADMILRNPVKITAQITNLIDYPDMVVVFYDGFTLLGPAKVQLYENMIPGNYSDKNKTNVYIINKEYLKKVGIENIDCQRDKNVQKLNVISDWTMISSSEAYTAIDVEFKLDKKNNTYYVYKSKITAKPRVKENQKAAANVVKTFKDDVVDPFEPIYVSERIL